MTVNEQSEEHDRVVDQVNRDMGWTEWTWRDVPRGLLRMIKELRRIWTQPNE